MRAALLRNASILALAHRLVFFQNFLTIKLVLIGNSKHLGKLDLVRVGTSYGGWFIPENSNHNYGTWVVVSAGLGYDTSFDLEMIKKGCYLIGLDPLSECCEIATSQLTDQGDFKILNRGLASWAGSQVFYAPKVSGHDSYSTINAQEVSNPDAITFPVTSLESLFLNSQELENAKFKILKMDIEGAELDILTSSLNFVNRFDFLAVEMDALSLIPFFSVVTRFRRITLARKILTELESSAQWCLVKTENFNFFWSKLKID
jgi:FkbM family methyltransferase